MNKILILFFLPILIFAQSEFINDEHIGIGANYGFVSNKLLTGSGGSFGISALGKFDIGGEFTNANIDNRFSSYDLETSSFLFYIAYNIKRKNNKSNFKILAGYVTTESSYNDFIGNENSGFAIGLSFSIKIFDEQNISFIPSLNLIYGFIDVEQNFTYYSGNGYSYSINDNHIENMRSISLDANFKIKASENINFVITPSISKDLLSSDNSILYSIIGGVMLDFTME